MIAENSVIYPNVHLGKGCIIEDFVIIGTPPKGYTPGELETVIGDYATIRSHTVIYAGNQIGNRVQTGNKANIREFNRIGDDVSIGTLSVIEHHITIGHRVRIHTQAFIPEQTILENDCWIGPNVVLTNAKYPTAPDAKSTLKAPLVKKNAIIGANTTLLPGVTIGEFALIGAGSIVTRDVPPRVVVVGNPAKITKNINQLPISFIP